jgi:hypothetical protein
MKRAIRQIRVCNHCLSVQVRVEKRLFGFGVLEEWEAVTPPAPQCVCIRQAQPYSAKSFASKSLIYEISRFRAKITNPVGKVKQRHYSNRENAAQVK